MGENRRDEPDCGGYLAPEAPMSRTLSRTLTALAFALVAGCSMDDTVPPGPPSTGPTPRPQPRPGPVDAGDTDTPFPVIDGGIPDAAVLSCGDFGAACCPDGRACLADFTRCDPTLGICAACGDTASDCCTDGPACMPGLTCSAGVCGP
jgi:hypothetical protein